MEETASLAAAEIETAEVKTAEVEMSRAKKAKGESASPENLLKIFAGNATIATKLDIESVNVPMSTKRLIAAETTIYSGGHDQKKQGEL